MKKKIYISFILCFCTLVVQGQNFNLGVGVNGSRGFLLAHRSIMAHLPQAHTTAFNAKLSFIGNGDAYWQKLLNHPRFGLELIGTSLGNQNVLGKGAAALYFVDVPLSPGKFYPSIYGGIGLGWVEKIYDVANNPKNNAMGTHLNAAIRLGLNFNYDFQRTNVQLGIHMMHFSNGATKMPNLGVNLPYVQLGVTRYFRDIERSTKSLFLALKKEMTRWRLLGVYSKKDVYPLLQKPSNVFSLSVIRTKYKSKYWSYDLGVEFIFNQAQAKMFPEREIKQNEILQIGIYSAYVLSFDCLDVFVGLGGYAKNDLNIAGWLYQKVGARYQFNDRWAAQLAIKANYGKADYIEYGINYTLHEK